MRTLTAALIIALLTIAAPNTTYLPLILSQPTSTPTETLTPTPIETATDTPTETPTETATPTPTETSTPQPTATTIPSGPCLCDSDRYNCSDFSTQAAAQACFNYCVSLGRGDIHKLDRDNNGVACESLPLTSARSVESWVKMWDGKIAGK